MIEAIVILGGIACADGFEFRDVGPSGECLGAGAAQYNDADRGIGFGDGNMFRNGPPHPGGECIRPGRIVGNDPGDRALDFEPQLWLGWRRSGHFEALRRIRVGSRRRGRPRARVVKPQGAMQLEVGGQHGLHSRTARAGLD